MSGDDAGGSAGEYDDFICDGDGLADVVRDEHGGLVFAADNFVYVVADAQAGLVVERGKRLV